MSNSYVAAQKVRYSAMSAWYGAAFPMGIDHKVRPFETTLFAEGSTSAEALKNLQRVVEGYCDAENLVECQPKGEASVDLTPGQKSKIGLPVS